MTDLHTLYLPVVLNTAPPAYGVQIDGPLTIPVTQHRIYHTPVRWMEPGAWIPDTVSAVDPNPLIIGTRTCPEQYRLYPDRMGSPPKPEYYEKYVEFVVDLYERYHPWGIEVWNEPDCPTYSVPPENQWFYGAWVNNEDYYQAGRDYGELLAMVYSVLSGTGCQILGGALQNGHVVQGREFLRGMLETGLCDYVSTHIYPFYGDNFKQIVEQALQSVQSMTDKPLFISETALLTKGEDTEAFKIAQAYYLSWLREYMAWDGTPWLWYSHESSWYSCGLYRDDKPTPVYDVWKG
jgi:hypothetical protein